MLIIGIFCVFRRIDCEKIPEKRLSRVQFKRRRKELLEKRLRERETAVKHGTEQIQRYAVPNKIAFTTIRKIV